MFISTLHHLLRPSVMHLYPPKSLKTRLEKYCRNTHTCTHLFTTNKLHTPAVAYADTSGCRMDACVLCCSSLSTVCTCNNAHYCMADNNLSGLLSDIVPVSTCRVLLFAVDQSSDYLSAPPKTIF